MDTRGKEESQEDFIYDRLPVIVATNAFGMGIDKSQCRYVFHYNIPQVWKITIRRPGVPEEMGSLLNAFCCSRPGML